MVQAICREIAMRKDFLTAKSLRSLYFGGGTPSILSADEIQFITDKILHHFSFDADIEITLEANPDDLDKNFLSSLAKTPVNRLSVGTQSFFEKDLKLMNRAHTASQAEDSIKRAQDFGFENLSIDLIYGAPTANMDIWKENLYKTAALLVPHISAYALTVEPKTALEKWISAGKVSSPKEEIQHEEFLFMTDYLKNEGFEHYEISNFAKPGKHSRHNSAYWQGKEYLGIGPSAHSFNGKDRRSWNIAHNIKYIHSINSDVLPEEIEFLSPQDRYNEMIMIGLRTKKGIFLDHLYSTFSAEMVEKFQQSVQKKLSDGILQIQNSHLSIPEEKWFMADGIAADLFQV